MGGEVGFASEPGQGSRFWSTLKLAAGSPVGSAMPREADFRVLIASDHPVLCAIVGQQVARIGGQHVRQVEVAEALEQVRGAVQRGVPYRMLRADFDFASGASQRLVSALRGDANLKELYLALLAPVTARLENGWKSDSDRIVSLNKPARLSQLARVIEDCITGTCNWRRRTAHKPAAVPCFAGRVLLVEANPVHQPARGRRPPRRRRAVGRATGAR